MLTTRLMTTFLLIKAWLDPKLRDERGSVSTEQAVITAAVVLLAIAIGDHPRVTAHTRSAELIIDQAITDPAALERRTSELLGGVVTDLVIRRVDLINDSTTVQVRYRLLTTNDTTAGNQLDKPNTYQGPFEPAMRATGNREPLR